MTCEVLFGYEVPANDADGLAHAGGWVRCRPSKTYVAGDVADDPFVLGQELPPVPLVNGQATIYLRPTGPDWYWIIYDPINGLRNVAVPDVSGPVNASDLVDVDPTTYDPLTDATAAWYVALAALQSDVDALGGGGSGASLPAGGTAGQSLVKQSSTDGDADWATLTKADVGLTNVDNTSDASKPISAAQAAVNAAKADLVGGIIPTAQIPALSLTATVTAADQTAMLAFTSAEGQPGDLCVRTDGAGTFVLTATDPSLLASWTLLNAPTDVVTSVAGQTGTVVLAKADVGLGSVDNTSDADKPVSTAQAAAIAAKADPADITAAIDSLISGAPGALDTLNELAAALGDDAAFSATVTAALAARVRVDTAAQGLTGTQQSNARTNIGAGTSSLAVGTTAADAKAGNWTPGLADLPASTVIATASGTRPSSRTDLPCLFINTTPDGSQLTNDVWLKP